MLSMKGGNGDDSYVKNSKAQARHARSVVHVLEAALNSFRLPSPAKEKEEGRRALVVADLGCASGSNSVVNMDIVVNHVSQMYEAAGREAPEFHVFFTDLPSNDFNALFQFLPPLSSTDGSAGGDHRSYFRAGVPGSFYDRLLPAAAVDIFHSTFSLHWISQVPESVIDKQSAAYNKDRVFVHGAPESVAEAYSRQYKADLGKFLQCRAREMKDGGVMFLALFGRVSSDPADQDGVGQFFGVHFQEAWNDLVDEGLLDREKRDSFNVPVYAGSLEEFREVVEANGSFAINRLELVKGGSPLAIDGQDAEDAEVVGRTLAKNVRSVVGVLVDAHIGETLSEELFARLERRAASRAKEIVEHMHFFHIVAALSFATAHD